MLLQPLFCSGRLLQPFVAVLEPYPELAGELERLRKHPTGPRIATEWAHEHIVGWVQRTGDVDLGLRAAEVTRLGALGLLDYALHTAATLRESVSVAERYSRLYSEALEISIVREHERVWLRVEHTPRAPRALTDFVLASYYRNHLKPHLDPDAQLECCFRYAEPAVTAVHHALFDGVPLRFGAPFDGFVLDPRALDRPLDSGDPALHRVHCEQIEAGDVADAQTMAFRVRRQISVDLQAGRPKAGRIARTLRMSRRTLARQLAREGTSFSGQLDEFRRDLALQMVFSPSLSLAQLARSLGFTHVQAFHRSFKRWTGVSPRRYRAAAEEEAAPAPREAISSALQPGE